MVQETGLVFRSDGTGDRASLQVRWYRRPGESTLTGQMVQETGLVFWLEITGDSTIVYR